MQSGIYTLAGVVVGGLITWGIQYFFRKQDRKWKQEEELRRVALEAVDILHELLDFYDTYPQPEHIDETYIQALNDRARKSRVKVKVMFYSKDKKLIETFEEADHALKEFVWAEKDHLKTSKKARQKVEEFDEIVQHFFESSDRACKPQPDKMEKSLTS